MTIADNYAPLRQLGNGVTVNFSASWDMISAVYAQVFLEDATTGIQTLVTQGAGANQYMIAINSSGFIVTFNTAPTSTNYVIIGRAVTRDQTDSYKTSEGFQGAVNEDSFDKLTAMIQENTENINRTVTVPLGDTATDIQLPSALARSGRVLGFDASGNVIVVDSVSTVPVSSAMQPVVAAATLTAARTAMGVLSSSNGVVANANLATMAANTVKTNATAGVASPTDLALAVSNLLGRGASGNIGAITLGTNLSMAGSVLNASGGTSELVFLGAATASNSASLIFSGLAGASYAAFELYLDNFVPVTDVTNLQLRLATSGGTINSGYVYQINRCSAGGSGATGSNADNDFVLNSTSEPMSNTNGPLSAKITIYAPDNVSSISRVNWSYEHQSSNGTYIAGCGGGAVSKPTSALTGLTLFQSSGNLSTGTARLYGLKNT